MKLGVAECLAQVPSKRRYFGRNNSSLGQNSKERAKDVFVCIRSSTFVNRDIEVIAGLSLKWTWG